MTPKREDLQERKDRILGIAVNEYIKTVSPVSSKCISKEYPLDLSSASIRNILAELEIEGYLTHPHTSAGRVPTEQGYRYYVDNLMDEIHLLESEKLRIKNEYDKESLELDRLLEKTTQVTSEITHYTSIISVDGWGDKLFCHGTSFIVEYPEYDQVERIRDILMALEEKKNLLVVLNQNLEQRIKIYIGHEIACSDIEGCSLVVSPYKSKKGPSGRIAVLGPTRMNYEKVVSTLGYISDLVEEML